MSSAVPSPDPHVLRLATPRLTRYIPHRPTPQQAAFLLVRATEAFYGGAAGGGKTDALLMAALQYVDVPGYAALLVRESYPMFTQPGGLIARSHGWLDHTGATWNESERQWTFPSGATLTFRSLPDAGAERNFQGSEYDFIGVDEVTDFLEDRYRFLFSRLRSHRDSQIPLRMRVASNPYGPGREWVYRRFILEGRAAGRVFIPARLEDNPFIEQDSYDRNLRELGPLVYQQLRHGDWTVRPEGGLFKSAWLTDRICDMAELPEQLKLCRAWDLASSEARAGTDPDHTAGVLLGRDKGISYVIDVVRARTTPLGVEKLVRKTAERDRDWASERGYAPPMIVMEQEPGSAGKAVIDRYRRDVLAPFSFRGIRSTGTKETRAEPVAARAEAGELLVCRGAWNTAFLDEVAVFPLGRHDDQVDALSAAFSFLADRRTRVVPMPISITKESYWSD
ncbi:MAG: phage terminase large subunit [Actinomycetota bacterium]